MMLPDRPIWIDALLLAGAVTLAFGAGWAVNGWRLQTALAELEKTQAEAVAKAATENAELLAFAGQRAGEIAHRLAQSENALAKITEEKDHEIRRLTTGRRCLDAGAVRVLNQPAGHEQPARAVPDAAAPPVFSDAAFATDTDVGTWIAGCQRSYDTCRGRLDGIADFYQGNGQ